MKPLKTSTPRIFDRRPTIDIVGGFFKRRAIRRFLLVLGGQLAKDYGHRGPYTPAQVDSTLRRYKTTSPAIGPMPCRPRGRIHRARRERRDGGGRRLDQLELIDEDREGSGQADQIDQRAERQPDR